MNIITHCQKCAFAIFDENNHQTGCKFNRIDKFKNLGYDVQMISSDDKQYNIINTKCNACVTQEEWDNLPQRETRLFNHMKIKNSFIVIDDTEDGFSQIYNNLLTSCHSALFSEIQPEYFVFVMVNRMRCTAEQNIQLFELIKSILNNSSIIYKIVYVDKVDKENSIDWYLETIKDKFDSEYFSVFNSGYSVPKFFNSHLNDIVNVDCKRFILYAGDDNRNEWTMLKEFVEHFGWYSEKFIGNEILKDVKQLDNEHLNNLVITERPEVYAKPTTSNYRNS